MASLPTHTVAGVKVGRIGYGTMNLTWKPKVTPDEQAFAVLKAAVDGGANMINAGEFYGQPPDPESGLRLLARFFETYPDYVDKVYLSVKGGLRPDWSADSSLDALRKSVTNINALLKYKKIDLFESARVDKTTPIEEAMKNLKTLSEEGHFKHIGLSEVSSSTIRRAAAVVSIAAVEAEYSPWALDIEQNGVLSTCQELGIPIVAYSPLGRGFLTGSLKSRADIPEGDSRLMFDRFSEENLPKNLALVDSLTAIAQRKGVSPAQLALAWALRQWEGIIPIPGSTRVEGVKESLSAATISLSASELAEIRTVLDSFKVEGGRYHAHAEGALAV